MNILLINPPYQTLTSNLGVGHQVPLGLLMVGGPLRDAGHQVKLLDAECRRMSLPAIIRAVQDERPHLVMTGHAGSTPAHPVCLRMLRAIKAACPEVVTVYGGVYPTYHAAAILAEELAVDVIVRGEGEVTAAELVRVLSAAPSTNGSAGRATPASAAGLGNVRGLAYRSGGQGVLTPDRPPLHDLDAARVGWELIERWDDYQCFGLGRAAIVQFSRGCPHRCTYCGQHGFWVQWRHRDPVRLADEIAWLHDTHGVRFITLADENPTTLPGAWRRFLEELAGRRLPVSLFATIRATDIVRDANLLPLYRRAGMLYVLMGIESTDGAVLRRIQKGSTPRHDWQACHLLKQHGIFSILGHIVGFEQETWATFRTARRRLIQYDGDWLNAMYVTPHRWTAFAQEMRPRRVVQDDPQKWDYRHQVLAQRHLTPGQLFAAVKWLEFCYHLRPGRLWSMWRTRDRFRRRQLFWTLWHIGRVWLGEIAEFLLATSFARRARTLGEVQAAADTPSPPDAGTACSPSRAGPVREGRFDPGASSGRKVEMPSRGTVATSWFLR
jgi:anaerobic magnesium-protoporphyrin IX monomethyl ester cyclase